MNSPDQDTVLRAVEDAQRVLGEHRSRTGDPVRTIELVMAILDNDIVRHALDRMKRRRVLRLVD